MLRHFGSALARTAQQSLLQAKWHSALAVSPAADASWSKHWRLVGPHVQCLFSTATAHGSPQQGHGISSNEEASTSSDVPGGSNYNPAPHPSKLEKEKGSSYLLMHPVYTKEYMESVKPRHRPTQGVQDRLALLSIQTVRASFDLITGYGHGKMSREKWLTRVVFLETVAGVPGMVGGMIRHLHSLRLMRRDNGWIHTLLEEAENERMHLLTFLKLKQPGFFFRTAVLGTQGIFCNIFFLAYLISPSFCHRLVGYLEEEAVKTYTHLLTELDDSGLDNWGAEAAPNIAKFYWRLGEDATVRDLVLAVRADEACHSHVNHTFAGMPSDAANPFSPGSHHVP